MRKKRHNLKDKDLLHQNVLESYCIKKKKLHRKSVRSSNFTNITRLATCSYKMVDCSRIHSEGQPNEQVVYLDSITNKKLTLNTRANTLVEISPASK